MAVPEEVLSLIRPDERKDGSMRTLKLTALALSLTVAAAAAGGCSPSARLGATYGAIGGGTAGAVANLLSLIHI